MPGFGRRLAAFLVVFSLAPAVVSAQQPAGPGAPKDQNPSQSGEQNAPEHFDSQANQSRRSNETLSERLDRSDGVIRPPAHVDPEIHETPPPTRDKGIIIPAPPSGGNPEPK